MYAALYTVNTVFARASILPRPSQHSIVVAVLKLVYQRYTL